MAHDDHDDQDDQDEKEPAEGQKPIKFKAALKKFTPTEIKTAGDDPSFSITLTTSEFNAETLLLAMRVKQQFDVVLIPKAPLVDKHNLAIFVQMPLVGVKS